MNLDKPSAKLDLAVAKAAGIDAYRRTSGSRNCVRRDGSRGNGCWNPSRDWNDAMEAAEKVGLFDESYGNRTLQWEGSGVGWTVRGHSLCVEPYSNLSGPLAICAAILKNPKGKPDAHEND